jgi:hypothetical protein
LDSDDLSAQDQAAAVLGTAITFTAAIGVIGAGVCIDSIEEVRWLVSRAGQVNPWTRARRRLIERIRFADRRMAAPSWVLKW